jgi:predicted Zn-dependent protease
MNQDHINSKIITMLKAAAEISAYQLNLTSNHTVKSGFINNDFGGVYRPVINLRTEGIEFRVLLKDGRSSIGSAPFSVKPDDLLAQIMVSAHKPAEDVVLAQKDADESKVELADKEIQEMLNTNPEAVSKLTKKLQSQQLEYGHESIEGGVKLISQGRRLVSSAGIDMSESTTRQSLFTYYEGRLGVGLAQRSLFDPEELRDYSTTMSQYTKQLCIAPAKLANGTYPALLDASEGWGLLDKFVLGNLAGDTVDAGQSRFNVDDFKNSRAIAHPGLSLHYNQRKPMSTESFNFSTQGVPSQQFTLIENGKLTEPICNLKIAKKFGYKAKALTSLLTKDVAQNRYDDFVKKNKTFILVFGVMGVHTAKTALGNYSFPAPDALLVQDGEVVGPVSCILSGNFFDVLMQPSTEFVDAPHMFDYPALTFETQVTFK